MWLLFWAGLSIGFQLGALFHWWAGETTRKATLDRYNEGLRRLRGEHEKE